MEYCANGGSGKKGYCRQRRKDKEAVAAATTSLIPALVSDGTPATSSIVVSSANCRYTEQQVFNRDGGMR